MQMEIMQALKQAISNVLDMMFYLPVMIRKESDSPLGWFSEAQPLVGAALSFNGPVSGSSYLLMPAGLAGQITADFLGLDREKVTERHVVDTVKEALNMIAGSMLSRLDKADAFHLGLPVTIRIAGRAFTDGVGLQGKAMLIETEKDRLAAGITFN